MPGTVEALAIIVIVVAPGYVLATVAGDVIAFARVPGDLRILLPTITLGIAVHLSLSFWTIRLVDLYQDDQLANHLGELIAWGACLVFVVPIAAGVIIGRMSNTAFVDGMLDKIGLGYVDRMPSAWDFLLRTERSGFMRLHLKDQRVIGGVFYSGSFASTNPERPDIYLEQTWLLDEKGSFIEALPDSQGLWVSHDAIEYVEFFSEGRTVDDANSSGGERCPTQEQSLPLLLTAGREACSRRRRFQPNPLHRGLPRLNRLLRSPRRRITDDVTRFVVVLEPDSDVGGYNVSVPALPGCFTQAESVDPDLILAVIEVDTAHTG